MVSLDWRQQVNSVAKWTACLRLLHRWNKQQSVIKVLYVLQVVVYVRRLIAQHTVSAPNMSALPTLLIC